MVHNEIYVVASKINLLSRVKRKMLNDVIISFTFFNDNIQL